MKSINEKIAVIGMACRFPGANNINEYWNNILEGKETIKRFTDEELSKIEYRFEEIKNNPDFVRARGILDEIDKFDSEFFGMIPKEAAQTDPQHRVWLETAWEAFEDAGCDPISYGGKISVYAGGSPNSYLLNNILREQKKLEYYIRMRSSDSLQIATGNDLAYLPTKTAFKFNLKGAAINVQTACSTSLVAISEACQSLYTKKSDICLAGAVSIMVPQETGYIYQEGSIISPEGFCRPFDSEARGTVFSNGVGAVVLKRLDDAIRDHDRIYAVVSGWATNNDGSDKLSYTAPSIDGQAEVISMAQANADISPEEISYIESHGTGTLLGDPIEIAGLKKAFSFRTNKKQFCGIGSVKSNIGHTDVASGVASFIKTCLIAYTKTIPPLINFSAPNPFIDFENSPFYVQKETKVWKENRPLIMGVSNFGIGGTNAHVIVEETPKQIRVENSDTKSEWPDLIVLSAKSEASLKSRLADFTEFQKANTDSNIRDVAYTLGMGRNHMSHRSFTIVEENKIFSNKDLFTTGKIDNLISGIAFMFPGQGAQYVSMGKDLYKSNHVFRQILDECFEILKSVTGEDVKTTLFENTNTEEADKKLASTSITQPVLFIIEYALVKIFEQLDIRPKYMVGHSIGEYTAACIAGVFDLESALRIVIKRGQLMQKMKPGSMLAVRTGIDELKRIENSYFEIAADNAPSFCTISFQLENTERVKTLLEENNIQYIPLKTSHAFHSVSFDPILSEFAGFVEQFNLRVPELPFISCLTGEFITNEQATSGKYWAQQLRNTVQFRKGISTISGNEDVVYLEVGPNTHLSSLVRQNKVVTNKKSIISTLGKPDDTNERFKIITALGNMFNIGININFHKLQNDTHPYKISLPTYPFERKRHWVDYELPGSSDLKIVSSQTPLDQVLPTEVIIVPEKMTKEITSLESGIIMNIWKSQTGIQEIGLDEDFFEIGGQSLIALQVLTRIKEELNCNISLKTFYANPTINKLLKIIGDETDSQHTNTEIIPTDSLTNLPLSTNQQGVWIFSQVNNDNPSYNIPFTYHLKGKIDEEIFEKSIIILFNRHPIVFSVFKQNDGVPSYDIIPTPVKVSVLDFSNESAEESREKIYDFAGEDSRKTFNISTGPLFRIYLLKQNESSYYFHVTIHHLVFDGWSWHVFLHDFKKIYESILENREPDLEKIAFHYYDFTKWEEKNDSSASEASAQKFWIEYLKGCNEKINFPYDFPRKSTTSGLGDKEIIKIPSGITSALKDLNKKENASLFHILLSAYGILFQKYSGENDLNIGTAVTNRPQTRLEMIFGMFIQTTVIRLKIDEKSKFNSLVAYTKESVLDAMSHTELSFEKIVETVRAERSFNFNPLFQISFVWLNNIALPMDINGIKGDRITLDKGVSPFDITFYLWENNDWIEGEIEYNVDILERDTIVRLRENFLALLKSITENPDKPIAELNIISELEEKVVSEINATDAFIPDVPAHVLFENQVTLNPLQKALISEDTVLTYKELDDRSNKLANHLVSLGLKTGDVVGICLERSLDMVVSLMGVLKAGGAFLPLDPIYPPERINVMIEEAVVKILITKKSLQDQLRIVQYNSVVLIDRDESLISENSTQRQFPDLNPGSLAYLIFTSGSTGKPKGVKIHHSALVNWIQGITSRHKLDGNDSLLSVSSPSFDISVFEIFMTLSNGATLILANSQDVVDGVRLARLIEKKNVTIMVATPGLWSNLLDNNWKGKTNLRVLCGGETLTLTLVKRILPKVQEFYNYYGPTETTVCSTGTRIFSPDARIYIGKPLNNTRIYILDKNNHILPVGAKGEIAIGGSGVSQGYINSAELTAEKFIRLADNNVIYKTGDLGRLRKDGNVEHFGRIDFQIKLRGYRIEPGEIENALLNLSGVREVAVKIHSFDENDNRLVAFLNVDAEFHMTDEQIKESLVRKLPPYMIPSFIMRLSSFPRTTNGKTDKNALVLRLNREEIEPVESVSMLNATQIILLNIFAEILKVKSLKETDSFFNIGGNSLLAIRVMNRIKENFGFTLTFKTLIENQTIAQLSTIIDNHMKTGHRSVELAHTSELTNLPLSFNQQRLWLITKLNPDTPSYIVPISYRFAGALDIVKFEESLNLLFHRHHTFFSVIKTVDDELCINIIPHEVKIKHIDYSNLSANDKERKISDFINSDSKMLFDINNGPLYRLHLIDAGNKEYYFQMTVHHVIFDGWSWQILVTELNQIYNSLLKGEESELKNIEFHQYDYAIWEKANANFSSDNNLIEFWRSNLKDVSPVLNFPYDYNRKSKSSGKGIREGFKLSAELTDNIRKLSKTEDSSIFGIMMSAFAVLLQKYSGEDDFCIGTPVAYRPHSDLENIIGMFVNTIVIRTRFAEDFTFKSLIRFTKDALFSALAHQELPFEKIVDIVNPKRGTNINPIFQASFAWQNDLAIPIVFDGITSTRISGSEGTSIFDISMYMWENGDILEGEIEFNEDLVTRDSMLRFKKNFLTLTRKLAETPDKVLNSIPLITEEDLRQVLGFTETIVPYPNTQTIVDLFEEQARMYSDKTALIYKTETLTYRQLNEQANQLAHKLSKSGIRVNTPVAILADRSIGYIVGILGILKAGGGYVPIDPDYPVQRMNFILKDSGCNIILIQDKYKFIEVEGVTKINLDLSDSFDSDKSAPGKLIRPDDLAYIMYTSGTTGIPKGSMIVHKGIIRLVRNTNYIDLKPEDRILLTGAIVFDATTFEIWGALLNGGALYLVEKETILNPRALGEELKNNDITVLWLTSPLLTQIAEHRADIFTKLKYLLSGGDVLSSHHVNKVRKENPGLKVLNCYGPTENTTFSTTYLIGRDYDHNIPIGKPISNSTAYIFDRNLNYQPIGVIGELYVGGDGLSKGYLNREDLNKKSFIEHPQKPGERLYSTGDFARWLPDGNIEFHGRVDNQLKIRGFRVELGEIESVISEIDGIIETVVRAIRHDDGDMRLAAFLNVSDTYRLDTKELSKRIKEKLPPYMIPTIFKAMHGFPKTVNGKIDTNALTLDSNDFVNRENRELKSLTATEKKILDIWCDVLKTKDVLTTDNFFEIGGNSLLAITVMSKIESVFNMDLGLRIFFDSPRIRDLAESIDIASLNLLATNILNRIDKSDLKIVAGKV